MPATQLVGTETERVRVGGGEWLSWNNTQNLLYKTTTCKQGLHKCVDVKPPFFYTAKSVNEPIVSLCLCYIHTYCIHTHKSAWLSKQILNLYHTKKERNLKRSIPPLVSITHASAHTRVHKAAYTNPSSRLKEWPHPSRLTPTPE